MSARNTEPSRHRDDVTHLERLAEALSTGQFTAELVKVAKLYLKVANATTPRLNERVQCAPAGDGSWAYWWPWDQPIGPVDDLPAVIGKITAVLRSSGGSP